MQEKSTFYQKGKSNDLERGTQSQHEKEKHSETKGLLR